jgi:hypothetical protein
LKIICGRETATKFTRLIGLISFERTNFIIIISELFRGQHRIWRQYFSLIFFFVQKFINYARSFQFYISLFSEFSISSSSIYCKFHGWKFISNKTYLTTLHTIQETFIVHDHRDMMEYIEIIWIISTSADFSFLFYFEWCF